MSAVKEGNMDINNEDRHEPIVHSSGQFGNLQIITKNDGAEFKSLERRPSEEMCRKRKKHRRGRPKRKQWLRKKDPNEKEGEMTQIAMKRRRANIFLHGQPAPNNTTQFIMEDHTDLQLQQFNIGLHCVTSAEKSEIGPGSSTDKVGRARDSSFSVDSGDEFYSSPEDEEEFLTKEFSNTYEDVHVERLGTMTKAELIEEYLQLEKRVDGLEKKLKSQSSRLAEQQGSTTGNDSDGEVGSGELPMDPDTAEKIRIFQEEIGKLIVANRELIKENKRLRVGVTTSPASPFSSVDSESDSSSSSESSHSSSSSSGTRKGKGSPMSEDDKNNSSSADSLVDVSEAGYSVPEEGKFGAASGDQWIVNGFSKSERSADDG